ncbi:MAG: transporter substrate-binding domain-containing protein [Rhodobacteraceae bacterium]|nr:transporter substrate-binding domain-containing protein [Paracoccaceae bacterium]
MNSILKKLCAGVFAVSLTTVALMAGPAAAEGLLEKAKSEGIRIGFANEKPWAYPGEKNKPLGFVNAIVLGTLKKMGIDKVEPVVTDWGGLIPGINANRYDMVTGGMYILKTRCQNMDFSDPIGIFGDVFVVATGNPKKLHTYSDIKGSDATLVTGAGYNIVEFAKKAGVPDSQVMQVPGPTEMLAALLANRADAIGTNFFGGRVLAEQSDGKAELADPASMPVHTKNWVGIGFRKADADFRAAYNKAQKEYLGTDEMMAAVAEYGYTKAQLPGDATTEFACANR